MSDAPDNWDVHWDRYAASASENPAQHLRHRIIVRWLRRTATSGMRLFDIGSGQGDLLVQAQAALPTAEMLGVELSTRGVAISREKLPSATLLAADLFSPPAELSRFQDWATHAVCSEVLEHVDDPAQLLRQAAPYLAPGARLLVTVPGGPMSAFDRHIGHRQHFDRASITRVLKEAGFEVDGVQRAGFPFFNLYRALVIARGNRLAQDVEGSTGASSPLARLVMRVFDFLFHCTLPDAPGGWQIVALARKPTA